MKRLLAALLVLLFTVTALSACGRKAEDLSGGMYYDGYIREALPGQFPIGEKIPGMAEDLCLIQDESRYDPARFQANFAGLFSEGDREVLYAKNALEKMYPASMTKLMTALLVIENCPDLSVKTTLSDPEIFDLAEGASVAYLFPGGTYTLSDLLYALFIPSGNDAANALAVHTAGSLPAFVKMMNERAQELGMVNTHYANAHDMHVPDHYTTVYDMYLLSRECAKHADLMLYAVAKARTIVCIREDGTEYEQSYKSGNSYLLGYTVPPQGVTIVGGKTGTTKEAGNCLTLIVTGSDGSSYIAVLGKCNGYEALYNQMNTLLEMIPAYEAGR